MNRVVITGMGAITPLGNDVASFWDGLKNGKIAKISESLNCKLPYPNPNVSERRVKTT